MIKTSLVHVSWAGYGLLLALFAPKLLGLENYGQFITDLSYAYFSVAISQSLITSKLFSSVKTNDTKTIYFIKYASLIFISLVLVLFLILKILDFLEYWLSCLFIWSFVCVELFKRILLHQEHKTFLLFLDFFFRIIPFSLCFVYNLSFDNVLLILFSGNTVYFLSSLIILNSKIGFSLKKVSFINLKTFFKSGFYLLQFNLLGSLLTFYFIRILEFNYSLIIIGTFFALKNLTSIVSPLVQWFESVLTRRIINLKEKIFKVVLLWTLNGTLLLCFLFSIIWIYKIKLVEFLNINYQSSFDNFILVLILCSFLELFNKNLSIYLRFLNKEKAIASVGNYNFILGVIVYSFFVFIINIQNLAIPLAITQLFIFLYQSAKIIKYENIISWK